MAQDQKPPTTRFMFPQTESKILPDPSKFLSPHLLSSPLPTNSFFNNFIVNNGDQPCFIHPYFVKLSSSSLSVCYPSLSSTSSVIHQKFTPDLTISTSSQSSRHCVSSFSDLSVTVDFPSSDLRFLLARGSPYVTLEVSRPLCLSFSTNSTIRSISSYQNSSSNHKIELESKQSWIIYSSSTLKLKKQDKNHFISSSPFSGVIRLAIIPNQTPGNEEILNIYSTCYPVSGEAIFGTPFCMQYKWEKKGWGDLLMLAHPLHLKLLSVFDSGIKVLENFKYKSIDGDLVGVIGTSWKLKTNPIPITWHSIGGISESSFPEIVAALWKDVGALDSTPISTTHIYLYAKKIYRGARLALIAEEVNCHDVMPAIRKFLKSTLEPWLVGKFEGNGFVYDPKWGGVVSKQGANDASADYGFGLFDNHHYYLGYFVFCIAVLAKIDPEWGLKFRGQAYDLVSSYMSLGRTEKSKHARLRSFDVYKLHSWAGSLGGNDNGGHLSHPCESVNAYYSASLMGMAYGDDHLGMIGSTLAGFEIEAVKTWWYVREGGGIYDAEFSKKNKLVGIVWTNKREDKLWFASAEHREVRAGLQVFPLIPICEIMLSDVGFVRELVDWVSPAMSRKEVWEGWKGYVHALEAIYDKKKALKKVRNLKEVEGNSVSNLLWWVHSRGGRKKFCRSCKKDETECWFCTYCC